MEDVVKLIVQGQLRQGKVGLSKLLCRSEGSMIVAIDPGEHIGVVASVRVGEHDTETGDAKYHNEYMGHTIEGADRNLQLWKYLKAVEPSTIIYETFALRPSKAMQLVGNKFVTCEVIGVINLYCQLYPDTVLIPLIPANKEYCGFSSKPSDPHYKDIFMIGGQKITEHTRDAFRLMKYAELFKKDHLKRRTTKW